VSVFQLFAACVAIWGSTWIAITFQLGSVAPEVSVLYRFVIASLLLFAWCRARGMPLAFTASQHAGMALQGLLMFSVSYVFTYYAEQTIVSGVVAVGYSASPLINLLLLRVLFGKPMSRRVALGGALGLAGIVLVFWPEFARLEAGDGTRAGIFYATAAVVISSFGSMAAHRNQREAIPIWQTMAWGMLYGSIANLVIVLALERPFTFEASASYAFSLVYLAIFGSILAFGSYLHLLERVGAARAGYTGVIIPIVALAISSVFENYRWTPLALLGVAISVAGNVVILSYRPAARA
jgi:drug/metabolite transporter (DMT)-like permease